MQCWTALHLGLPQPDPYQFLDLYDPDELLSKWGPDEPPRGVFESERGLEIYDLGAGEDDVVLPVPTSVIPWERNEAG